MRMRAHWRASLAHLVLAALAVAAVAVPRVGQASPPGAEGHEAADPRDERAVSGPAPASAMDAAELDKRLAPLTDRSIEVRRAAARDVSDLDEPATGAIVLALASMRRLDPDLAGVLRAARPERGASDTFDGLDALVCTEPNGEAYRVAVTTTALARALGHIGTFESTRELVRVAGDHEGAFRPEVARQVKRLGERAVPALILARKDPSPAVRRWAFAQLEAMNRSRPGEAIQTKSNVILADVLRAYAEVRDLDALTVILSFINADRTHVRTVARDALALYGDEALPRLREAYANLTGHAAPEEWAPPQVSRELSAAYDRLRLHEVYTLLDEGLARQKEGKPEEAALIFDKVLARQPTLDRKNEMVPTYVQYAHAVEARDRPLALAYLRKAARLDPDAPGVSAIESDVTTLEGEDLVSRGIADANTFRRALALNPVNTRARADLDRLEDDADARRDRVRRLVTAALILAIATVGIVLFGGKSRRPRTT
jgi:tetratricopeptide (TPR) repeat protein